MKTVFFDIEVNKSDKITDIGAVYDDKRTFHSADTNAFQSFVSTCDAAVGHNIIHHDLKYVDDCFAKDKTIFIDTLYWSPILFPKKPYHKLVKNDKFFPDEPNNPLNDSIRAQSLFNDELEAFNKLDLHIQSILYYLLKDALEFKGFFKWLNFNIECDIEKTIREHFKGLICENAPLDYYIRKFPVELAYVLSFVLGSDSVSVMPPWVSNHYPQVFTIQKNLCFISCNNCEYCKNSLSPTAALKNYFGYDSFRKYDGEPLQENAVNAAINDESILVIFPTGGGKSLTFQLPALMSGRAYQGLTVVISPLQSLMKDQVDNLSKFGISNAVTLNGLQDPIERAKTIENIENGSANLLYIAPESLRSNVIEKLIVSRNVVRFVIDEAHCFSAWGQDFRVDYQYIGKFIKHVCEVKKCKKIPVSCFTATAKQKVIADICSYFSDTLGIELKLHITKATRKNLTYFVRYAENDNQKYELLRQILAERNCPSIVYSVRTKRCEELSFKLNSDGFNTVFFHGKMDSEIKRNNQEAFMNGKVNIIIATSAFGMGVDKSDVGLVVHYDISDSLENYVQEAGRAGRNENTEAECIVLFNENDLNKHFVLLNQQKLSFNEIRSTYKAIKDITKTTKKVSISPLELARKAGFDIDVDAQMSCTKVVSAVAALENASYISRRNNITYVYATSIMVNSVKEAIPKIENSPYFENEDDKKLARRIISFLISRYSVDKAQQEDPECRIDYIAYKMEIKIKDAENIIQKMKLAEIIKDELDINANISDSDTLQKAERCLNNFNHIEELAVKYIFSQNGISLFNLKEINQAIGLQEKQSNLQKLHTLLYYWSFVGLRKNTEYNREDKTGIEFNISENDLIVDIKNRLKLGKFILNEIYSQKLKSKTVKFSIVNIVKKINKYDKKTTLADVRNTLFYLTKIKALEILDGFLVYYNKLCIERIEIDNKILYKNSDYKTLEEYYEQRVQQIHIVGKYANIMVKSYDIAMQYVKDYFTMDYKNFIDKYFTADEKEILEKSITKEEYDKIFGSLSNAQKEIIDDSKSDFIVVAAGPGSGKTKLLVHKLASLLLLENIKTDELLMLTFSHYAALEFRERLSELVGIDVASRVGIRTFHSFAFDLVGEVGSLENAENVIKRAIEIIKAGEAQDNKLRRTCIVIDEAQDMGQDEFDLLCALIDYNPSIRVIAVGDDDQNIFEFRGSSSKYFSSLLKRENAKCYELLENFRSAEDIVKYCNSFICQSKDRLKKGELIPFKNEKGIVNYYNIKSNIPELSISELLIQDMPFSQGESVAVLCRTNKEAEYIFSYLKENKINVKLIESNDGFKLRNLMELRFFMKCLSDSTEDVGIISKELFRNALYKMQKKYEGSKAIENCTMMLLRFLESNSIVYRSDLDEFIYESSLEDYTQTKDSIIVSTIHKAKGREYDRVYMLVKDVTFIKEEDRRCLYVGMTRAKKILNIFCNTSILDNFDAPHLKSPDISGKKLNHLIHILSLHDVALAFFTREDLKKEILSLKSGYELIVDKKDNRYLCNPATGHRVVMFSNSFYQQLNHQITRASIEYIVAWKDENGKEWAIILPFIETEST